MLSYATIVLDITVISSSGAIPSSNNGVNFRYSQRTNIKKACEGDSDLKRKGKFSTYGSLCRTVQYIHIYYRSRLNKKACTQVRRHQSHRCPLIKRKSLCTIRLVCLARDTTSRVRRRKGIISPLHHQQLNK